MHPGKIAIIPAILPHSFEALEEGLAQALPFAPLVQIDAVDGHYAKPKTWPYRDGKAFTAIAAQEEGMPHWEALDFEFDLMVADPAVVVMDYVHAGAARVIAHVASSSAQAALEAIASLNEREQGADLVSAGAAIRPHDNLDVLLPLADLFDYIQVMGIEHEGRQGETLDERVFTLIERLRHRYPLMPIQVDGGVRIEHVKRLAAAGATRLVCGSAIFGAEDPKAAYEALYNEANG